MDEADSNKLRQIYKDYDFMEYGTEEEEISKTIRCILEFIEEKPDLISIWNGFIVTSLSPVISKNFLSFFSVFLKKY